MVSMQSMMRIGLILLVILFLGNMDSLATTTSWQWSLFPEGRFIRLFPAHPRNPITSCRFLGNITDLSVGVPFNIIRGYNGVNNVYLDIVFNAACFVELERHKMQFSLLALDGLFGPKVIFIMPDGSFFECELRHISSHVGEGAFQFKEADSSARDYLYFIIGKEINKIRYRTGIAYILHPTEQSAKPKHKRWIYFIDIEKIFHKSFGIFSQFYLAGNFTKRWENKNNSVDIQLGGIIKNTTDNEVRLAIVFHHSNKDNYGESLFYSDKRKSIGIELALDFPDKYL
jgi:hypothetical protein